MFKFGKRSKKYIATVDPILQELANKAIEISTVDFGVLKSGGLRTAEEQNKLYKAKKSKCDGYEKKSYHQSGRAIDFVPYVDGGYTWNNKQAFLAIGLAVGQAWKEMADEDRTVNGNYLHWGGFWNAKDLDKDGILEEDDRLGWDCPHYELRPYKQTINVYPIEQQS